jgi:hypothetical protein
MKNDVLSIQEDIVNHVEYTMARSRYKFDDFEAYQATSLSLRDRLIGEPRAQGGRYPNAQAHVPWPRPSNAVYPV